MSWVKLAQIAAELAIDMAREWWRDRKAEPPKGWTYRHVKIANDASHRAGHEGGKK